MMPIATHTARNGSPNVATISIVQKSELPNGSSQNCRIIASEVQLYDVGSIRSESMNVPVKYVRIAPYNKSEYQIKNFPSLLIPEYRLRSFLNGTIT